MRRRPASSGGGTSLGRLPLLFPSLFLPLLSLSSLRGAGAGHSPYAAAPPPHALYVFLQRTERNAPRLIFLVLAPSFERAPPILHTCTCAA